MPERINTFLTLGNSRSFLRSLRYDNDTEFFEEMVKHHVSGQLKVAPEHVSDNVFKFSLTHLHCFYSMGKQRSLRYSCMAQH